MIKQNKKTLKLIAATSMTLFSLLTVFSACVAWFAMNMDVLAKDGNLDIVKPIGKLHSVDFYSFDSHYLDNDNNHIGYCFENDVMGSLTFDYSTNSVVATGNTDISFTPYGLLNRESPILLMFNLDAQYCLYSGEIIIKGITESDGFLGAREDEDGAPANVLLNSYTSIKTDGDNSVYYYGLSSVIKFMTKELSDVQYQALTGETTINFTYDSLLNEEGFVSINNDTESSTFNKNPILYRSSSSDVSHIALVIDYYSDAVEYIYSTYLGDYTLEELFNGELYFERDWSMEVLG